LSFFLAPACASLAFFAAFRLLGLGLALEGDELGGGFGGVLVDLGEDALVDVPRVIRVSL
jgi:hypothetical protein